MVSKRGVGSTPYAWWHSAGCATLRMILCGTSLHTILRDVGAYHYTLY